MNGLIKKWFYSYYKCSTVIHHLDKQKNIYALTGFSMLMLIAMRWNAWFGGWNEDSLLYIHYVTRITSISIICLYASARGFAIPSRKGDAMKNLLPIRFAAIIFISALLDMTKLIAYFIADLMRMIGKNE